jgi:aminoglycoside/choline kinase family phosphotransferase
MERLFEKWAGEPCLSKVLLPAHGSARIYYILKGTSKICLAACNDDVRENEAFISFSDFFKAEGVNVPEVYAVANDRKTYLVQYLGDTTLYDWLQNRKAKSSSVFDDETVALYKKVIDNLISLQFAGRGLDFAKAYPREAFDRTSMQWDLNYFKYNFLKPAHIPFDEQLLEDDFGRLLDTLCNVDSSFFLYRDFQSRNIMLSDDGDLYFIDYQGGRRGALHYDLASLLFDAKAEIPHDVKETLLDYYVERLSNFMAVDKDVFKQQFYLFALMRVMQAMGAYGFRGFFEGKEHFIKSIPHACRNMDYILSSGNITLSVPHLMQVWQRIAHSQFSMKKDNATDKTPVLTVAVNSFSFRRGYPVELAGNGGGFVFDCRALPNPGRYDYYKKMTGMDADVIDFLQREPVVASFVDNAFAMVSASVQTYIDRGFANLQVNFGCTGGRHRSVYCAEQIAARIKEKYPCAVVLRHLEQERDV